MDSLGEPIEQVLVPKPLHEEILKLAHSANTAAHLGVKCTQEGISGGLVSLLMSKLFAVPVGNANLEQRKTVPKLH